MFKLSAFVSLLTVSVTLVSAAPLRHRALNSLANGEFCGADVDCQSNNCQLVNALFTCVPPGSNGDGSSIGNNVVTSPTPPTLNTLPDGEFCGADVDCQSNNCQLVKSLFTCVPPGSHGDGSTLRREVVPRLFELANGEFCGADVDCQSNNCQLVKSLFTCVEPGSKGDGSSIGGSTAPSSPPPGTLNTLPDGEFCGADVDCQSNNCQLVKSLFTCVPPGSKGDGSSIGGSAPAPASSPAPAPPTLNSLPNGEFCGADVDCQSNNCQLVNSLFTCVAPGSKGDGSSINDVVTSPSAPPTLNTLPDGEFCGADVDCQSNNCQLVKSLFTCVPPGSKGDGSTL